jgi:hypothetical protein
MDEPFTLGNITDGLTLNVSCDYEADREVPDISGYWTGMFTLARLDRFSSSFVLLLKQQGNGLYGHSYEPIVGSDPKGIGDMTARWRGSVYSSGLVECWKRYDEPDVKKGIEYRGQLDATAGAIGGQWRTEDAEHGTVVGLFIVTRCTRGFRVG